MIPRSIANRFADRMGVDLHVAQQEIVLLFALDALREMGVLTRLVFKGGTYLRLMVTGDAGRLSEDLDFTNAGLPEDPGRLLAEGFAPERHGVRYGIREEYRTSHRNWGARVGYHHDWDEGEFRLEISYREAPFLPARSWAPIGQPYFPALPFPPPEIPCLRVEEGLAEKLRAIQQRATERDLYDAIRYGRKGFDSGLVRLLAVGKLWNDHERFDPDRILRTLADGRRDWPDLDRLVGRTRRRNWNRELLDAAHRFEFLRQLSPFERDLLADARRHRLRPELEHRLAAYA